jgi:dCTP deaminase
MLVDFEIRKAVQDGWIDVSPFDEEMLQPTSLDVRLGREYRRFRDDVHTVDTRDVGQYQDTVTHYYGRTPSWRAHTTGHAIPLNGLALRPGDFILASTVETLSLSPSMAARVEGKSSLGRLGVLVHVTAGFIDPGFSGQITLEIANVSPATVMIYAGMPIAQLTFEPVATPERDYSKTGRYQDQRGPTESRYRYIP